LWEEDKAKRGPKAPFSVTPFEPPVDELTDEFPLRLTTGRRLDSYNTGVQTGGYTSPLRRGETIDLSPEDADRLGVVDDEVVRVTSRRGSLDVPVRVDRGLRPGLVFMTLHFPDQVDTNILTIDATDPKSGTAEFKASAVRIEKISESVGA
jgi:formate dehydrogenase major subunit